MIDINMDFDLKKDSTISEVFGTIVSMAILLKDKGFSEEEIMTTLSLLVGCDLKPREEMLVVMRCMVEICGDYDTFIKRFAPIANQTRLDVEEGGKKDLQ